MSKKTIDCRRDHDFDEAKWPFDHPINTGVVTTKNIMERDYPVMAVLLDEDGDWQVLCGETTDPNEGLLVCLGCAYEKNPEIGNFSDLKPGYEAWRETIGSDWVVDKIVWDDQ